jgi:hypothetical protein
MLTTQNDKVFTAQEEALRMMLASKASGLYPGFLRMGDVAELRTLAGDYILELADRIRIERTI